MKIDLPLAMEWGETWVSAEAEILFDIAPHLAHLGTFAVHVEPHYRRWNVSNVETGLFIARSKNLNDRNAVIKKARGVLSRTTPQRLGLAYHRAIRKYPQVSEAKS